MKKNETFALFLFISFLILLGISNCRNKEESKAEAIVTDEEKIAAQRDFPGGEIAFASRIKGRYQIFKMQSDGSNILNLSDSSFNDENPRWSPDGKWIAFDSDREGNKDIFIMRTDGSGNKRITSHVATDMQPTWMPDSRRIVFESNRSGRGDLYIIDIAQRKPKVLFTKNKAGHNGGAAVSADGNKVVYMSNRFIGWNLFLGDMKGDAGKPLATEGGNCKPAWSPDGKLIAWVHHSRFNPVTDIWLMNADGSNKRNLTDNNPYWAFYPTWAPNGKWIAFASGEGKFTDDWEIYILEIVTGKLKRLTSNRRLDYQPDWSSY